MLLQNQVDFLNYFICLIEERSIRRCSVILVKWQKSKQNVPQMFKEDLDLKLHLLLKVTNDNLQFL